MCVNVYIKQYWNIERVYHSGAKGSHGYPSSTITTPRAKGKHFTDCHKKFMSLRSEFLLEHKPDGYRYHLTLCVPPGGNWHLETNIKDAVSPNGEKTHQKLLCLFPWSLISSARIHETGRLNCKLARRRTPPTLHNSWQVPQTGVVLSGFLVRFDISRDL